MSSRLSDGAVDAAGQAADRRQPEVLGPATGSGLALLVRGAERVISEDELRDRLQTAATAGRPLRVKLGLDPSAPDIHLGHAVVLRKLRDFQDLGHQANLVIGDFTGRIGDPSGRTQARRPMTEAEVAANAATYVRQLHKILDPARTVVRFNSEWLAPMNFAAVVRLASGTTVARMLERDDFSRRFSADMPIHLHEFFYPLMQGYDSVALEADVELGGSDQTFNLMMARQIQRDFGQAPEIAMVTPLLPGLDGVQKMSKSLGNYVGVDESPESMFGKLMSVPDALLGTYLWTCTRLPASDVEALTAGVAAGSVHPRDAKLAMAEATVALYHGPEAAAGARQEFLRVFSQGEAPTEVPERSVPGAWSGNAIDLVVLMGLAPSRSAARRLIEQGGVTIDGRRVEDAQGALEVRDGVLVRVGKRGFARVRQEA